MTTGRDRLYGVLSQLEHLVVHADSEPELRRKLAVLRTHGTGDWLQFGGAFLDRGRYWVMLARWPDKAV